MGGAGIGGGPAVFSLSQSQVSKASYGLSAEIFSLLLFLSALAIAAVAFLKSLSLPHRLRRGIVPQKIQGTEMKSGALTLPLTSPSSPPSPPS
jgi:hypothetical protein